MISRYLPVLALQYNCKTLMKNRNQLQNKPSKDSDVFFCSENKGLGRFTIFFVAEQVLRIFNEISANYTEGSRRTRRKLMIGHWCISTN